MGPNFCAKIGLDDRRHLRLHGRSFSQERLCCNGRSGWLSDQVSRNLVIAGAALASAMAAIGVSVATDAPLPVLLAAGALRRFWHPDLLQLSPPRTTTFLQGGCSAPREGFCCPRIGTAAGRFVGEW